MPSKITAMRLLDPGASEVGDDLRQELADIEALFAQELDSDLDCVNRLVAHIERYRGKMLRPTLVLLSSRAVADAETDPDPSRAEERRVVAAVVEMVHMATLVHDDILDDADVRRSGSTVNRLAGNESAVMLGDYLISHAYHLCNSLDRPWISRTIADATNTVCEGELLQLSNRRNWALDEATYREIIRRKTASLCGACCRVGARLRGVDDAVIQHLGRFGELLGEAFQIVDDLLDLTGDPRRVGKTLGRDLEKGKLTLPLLRMLADLDDDQRGDVHDLLDRISRRHATPSDDNGHAHAPGDPHLHRDAHELIERLELSGALDASLREARDLVDRAKACLTEVTPDSPARRALLAMADRVIDRRA